MDLLEDILSLIKTDAPAHHINARLWCWVNDTAWVGWKPNSTQLEFMVQLQNGTFGYLSAFELQMQYVTSLDMIFQLQKTYLSEEWVMQYNGYKGLHYEAGKTGYEKLPSTVARLSKPEIGIKFDSPKHLDFHRAWLYVVIAAIQYEIKHGLTVH